MEATNDLWAELYDPPPLTSSAHCFLLISSRPGLERYEHDSFIALHFFLNIIISPFNNWLGPHICHKASCLSSVDWFGRVRPTFRITASRGHRLKLNAGKSAGQFPYRVTSRYIMSYRTVSSQRRDSTSIRRNLWISHQWPHDYFKPSWKGLFCDRVWLTVHSVSYVCTSHRLLNTYTDAS